MTEENSRLDLTRRRMLGGLAATGVAATGAGAGTFAYFQDTEESTGNTIDAGTLDLKISDGSNGFGDGVSGTWTISNAKPGDSILASVSLQNSGSVDADHGEFDISVTETESDGPNGNNDGDTMSGSASGMAEQFEVTTMTYGGTNLLDGLSDANSNDIVDIGDLVSGNGAVLDDLNPPPVTNGGTEALSFEFRWAPDSEFDNSVSGVNNDYQGDELEITITMGLHQDGSQDL